MREQVWDQWISSFPSQETITAYRPVGWWTITISCSTSSAIVRAGHEWYAGRHVQSKMENAWVSSPKTRICVPRNDERERGKLCLSLSSTLIIQYLQKDVDTNSRYARGSPYAVLHLGACICRCAPRLIVNRVTQTYSTISFILSTI